MNFPSISILIVEDEAVMAMELANTLTAENYRVVGTAQDGKTALQLFNEHPVDLLLCDIHLPGSINGVQLVQKIKAIRPLPVVYLTSFTDSPTFKLAMDTQPGAYVIKPYYISGLRTAIDLAFNSFSQKKSTSCSTLPISEPALNRETILQTQGFIFIKQEYSFIKIRLDDITFVETDNNYIIIHLAIRRYILRLSLSAFLEKVKFNNLIRTHRSYAVNIGQVDFFNEQGVGIGKKEIPLSRQYRALFLHQFTIR